MKDYQYDIYRYYGHYKESIKELWTRPDGIKYLIVFRKCKQCKNILLKLYYKLYLKRLSKKTFIQIPYNTKIDKGFYIGHNGRI